MQRRVKIVRRRMKARAPPPPAAPRHIFPNTVPDASVESKENLIRPSVDFELTLPQGYRIAITEDGSKPLMDLLVDLCGRYHLSPALHTLDLLSPEGHPLGFKPNVLLGSLDVACVLIKEKACEEKAVRRPAPKVPEKTVRLMVNYHSSQKAVVRVNPLVPLQALIPVICEKCEFDPACVQLLKDDVSRQKLPLDKSLTQLGINELYVLDKSLVLQPKMASTPALNYSDSFHSSTNSLDRGARKGFFGLFQFGRRKSKTETTSVGMDEPYDRIIQNEGRSSAQSPVRAAPNREDRPSTLGQSHSVMNVFRTSPKCDTKKRRAPAPPPGALTFSTRQSNSEDYQMVSSSESQQRKRKAPAPPSTPDSICLDPYCASTSATPTPDSPASEKHSPAFCTKMVQTTTISSTTVKTTVKTQSLKIKVQPPSGFTVAPVSASPTPSSSTADSHLLQDSSSELSHSLDSDPDTDDAASRYSSLTSSTASGSVHMKLPTKRSSTKMKELDKNSSMMGKLEIRPSLTRISKTESESLPNLKPDEVENNRHGTMGTTDLPAPPKPRRSPAWERPDQSTPPPLSLEATKSRSTRSATREEEAASQSWFHSTKRMGANVQAPESETAEAETLSLGHSSSGSSLPDQGYAASEGMVDGDDSGLVSSPSDTFPTSPNGTFFLERNCGAAPERLPGPVRDISSDSDEGCATWGSNNSKLQAKSGKGNNNFDEKCKWFHQANMEADLPDISTGIPGVPVSVVDMNVPVTAIDEILEDCKPLVEDNRAAVLSGMKLADRKGSESPAERCNKNNNACTGACTKKSSIVNAKPDQYGITLGNGSSDCTKEKKNDDVKGDTQGRLAVKANPNPNSRQEHCNNTTITNPTVRSDLLMKSNTHNLHEDSAVLPQASQRSLSTEKVDNHSPYQNNSSSYMGPRKVTCNPTSRLGMKTFTIVPPKPSVMQGGSQNASAALTAGAIKIDEQGNIMKTRGHRSKVVDATESGITRSKECPLVGKAKAFWSGSEKQECALPCSAGVTDKAKGSFENMKGTRTAVTALTTDRQELQKTQHTFTNTAKSAAPKETGGKINKTMNNVLIANEPPAEMGNISVLGRIKQPQAALPSDLPPFLKPTRRTSSQYVASAINKYTPMASAKPNIVSSPSQSSPLSQNFAFHTLGHAVQVNPRQSSKISLTENNTKKAGLCRPGPVRSMSDPEFVSESQKDIRDGKEGNCGESTKDGSCSLGPVSDRIKHFQSSGPTQITERESRDVKANQCRSPSPTHRTQPQAPAKPPAATRPTAAAKPEPSRSMSDSSVVPGPPPVNVFGPVKKFKPVVCRSFEKDASLHSNLMEAIQAAGGKDRLKKISSSGARSQKEAPPDENERSALLAAIRDQSSTGRLRKTKSGAADELAKFKSASGEQRADAPSSPSPISLTCTFPASSTLAPPPPPLPSDQSKPSAVAHPNANAVLNPALAREAMMEAIRSGAAAEKLKKVAVPTKTVQVNGRMGTMHATSSSSLR
ncbi:protein cordon-bleu isoform X3 [Phyllopteryx taeniolatus]|uniref:protein cordon-bleu isoform X3 n=1 Tax=Phyllopteryx taeniolatus TaxID=161469 RepID=UPI002AD585FB|nr:protein cordon-bleu isoform X3 [Phyllopteryx taeniolatus]